MPKTAHPAGVRLLLGLTALLSLCSLTLLALHRLGIRPINAYLGPPVTVPLTAFALCLCAAVVAWRRLRVGKAPQYILTAALSLLAALAAALCLRAVVAQRVFGARHTIYRSPDGGRAVVVEEIRVVFRRYYTAYPVVFPGFYRLQGSGYVYLGESAGTPVIEWGQRTAAVTVVVAAEPGGTGPPQLVDREVIVVDFVDPKPWEPLNLL